jgi:LPS-assembly protein
MKLLFAVLLIFLTQFAEAFALVNFKSTKQSNLPAVLKAKMVSGDQINGDINAKGNVEISKDSNVIYANEVNYNKNTKIIKAFGDVKIKNLEIGYVLSPRIEIKDDFSVGDFFDARVFFVDGSYLFSKKMSRLSQEETSLKKSIFSICPNEEIVQDKSKAGSVFDFATISSTTSTINKEDNNLSSWNSVVKLYKIPILYIPYIKLPLPAKKRQTGILQTSYSKNSNFGLGIRAPYFIDVAKNKDLTITPTYYFNSEQLILNNSWRHFTKFGAYNLNTEISNNKIENNFDKTIITRSKKIIRWTIDGKGNFDFNSDFGSDFSIQTIADRNYLRDYHFNYLAFTASKINFDYINKRNYFGIKSVRFQELENASTEKNSAFILPAINSHFETKPLFFKEKLILDSNFTNITRSEGLQYRRASLTPQFKIPFNLKGNLFEFSTKFQGDLYSLNDKDLRNSDARILKSNQSNLKSEISFNWRLPIRNKSKKNTLTLEPIVNFVMSDFKTKNSLLPLEDSVDSELTFSNLFINDRISGFDRNEAGKRVSYGLKSSFFNGLGDFDFTIGQAFIIKNKKQDVNIRGFADNNKSNIVGIASYKGRKYFSLSYSFQLDQASYRNDINQIVAGFNYKKFSLSGDYLLIRKTLKSPNKKEQATISSSIELPYKWKIRILATRDFVEKRNIRRGAEILREGCCGDFSFSVIENNQSDLKKPQKTFNLNFTFKNL